MTHFNSHMINNKKETFVEILEYVCSNKYA